MSKHVKDIESQDFDQDFVVTKIFINEEKIKHILRSKLPVSK